MGSSSAGEFARRLAALLEGGEPCAVATVVEVTGSASARTGAKAILDRSGAVVFGWVGGGCAESTVREEALQAMQEQRPRTIGLDLDDEVLGVGMPCGGHMKVFIEPCLPQPRLLILGHGRIAETLAALAKRLGMHVSVNDPLAMPEAFPEADERTTDDPDYARVQCGPASFVVITTQHRSDHEALVSVLKQPAAYVGLVASSRRAALLFERLREEGFGPETIRRVHAPCGLDIGSETPEEIALSVLAEILQKRRGRGTSGRSLTEVAGVPIPGEEVEGSRGPAKPDRSPR